LKGAGGEKYNPSLWRNLSGASLPQMHSQTTLKGTSPYQKKKEGAEWDVERETTHAKNWRGIQAR